jgi:hypothetical protein
MLQVSLDVLRVSKDMITVSMDTPKVLQDLINGPVFKVPTYMLNVQ